MIYNDLDRDWAMAKTIEGLEIALKAIKLEIEYGDNTANVIKSYKTVTSAIVDLAWDHYASFRGLPLATEAYKSLVETYNEILTRLNVIASRIPAAS